jgi:hypothetical protein
MLSKVRRFHRAMLLYGFNGGESKDCFIRSVSHKSGVVPFWLKFSLPYLLDSVARNGMFWPYFQNQFGVTFW